MVFKIPLIKPWFSALFINDLVYVNETNSLLKVQYNTNEFYLPILKSTGSWFTSSSLFYVK